MPAFTLDQALQYGAQRHAAGYVAEAEAIYRQVLAQQPGNIEAMNLLGRAALDLGRLPEAAQLIGDVITAAPHEARYQLSWSMVHKAQGNLTEAVAAARRATFLAPGYAPAFLDFGSLLEEQNDLAGAEAAYRTATQLVPQLAQAHNDLGIVLDRMGRRDEALTELRTAVALQPGYVDGQCNLGTLLTNRGDNQAAAAIFEGVIRSQPSFVRAYRLLGTSLRNLGRLPEAIHTLQTAARLNPNDALVQNALGVALWQNQQPEPAITALRHAVQLDPALAAAHHHLGVVYLSLNKVDEATAYFRTLLDLEPANSSHHQNLAAALQAMGDLDSAIAHLRNAMELNPTDSHLHSALICVMLFHAGSDAKAIFAECRNWNQRHGEPWKSSARPHANSRDPSRRLRVGYVSPSFWAHITGRNLLPLFRHHDHERFEVFCYADVQLPDAVTAEFKRCADHWRNTCGMPDEALAELIRADGVDILVDLTQHLAGDRLPVFARRPAPLQVAFAGYPGTTGLWSMDYRLTDPHLDPPGVADAFYSEESLHLPHSYWCYAPLEQVPINTLPADHTGAVTFGCLSNAFKLNEPTLQLWARVLQSVEGSRLVVQLPEGTAQNWALHILHRQGIAAERCIFVPKAPHAEYLTYYHRVDIVLDTFPYNGHTTSLDALWMGIPVVSLAGDHALARAGVSQMANLGLPELVASSPDTFVEVATRLATDRDHLRTLRRTLRPRMEASPLMDAAGFTRDIEAAYRIQWQRWCAKPETR